MNTDEDKGLSPDEKIIREAKDRFTRAEDWESEARSNFIFDMKFMNGDSQNQYQWDDSVSQSRRMDNRPCLTVNKTAQHCLQIINDQRQNPAQMEVRPVGNGASYEASTILEGICRHVEYQSNAQNAYSNGCYNQVVGGIGYWRVVTDYSSEETFDQEIYIRRVGDPLSIYLDPDINEADGSDAKWAFVYKDMPLDEFELEYPNEEELTNSPLGIDSGWTSKDTSGKDYVRVCEYFRKSMRHDKLHELDNGMTVRESMAKKSNLYDQLKQSSVRSRDIETPEIEWFLIGGSRIIDRKPWPGRYIPIVRVVGQETVIDKRLDRKGHVRCLIDPQRIYNYWTSSAVEQVALQTKTPYLTDIRAIAGFETQWKKANIENNAYLPYRSSDENGNEIAKPERSPPPEMGQAYIEGLKISAGEMMIVSGQYEANMGQKSNEVSGTAVDARQRQGENATYHYIDRFASAIRFTGRILIDLIPHVYDTQRIIKILAQDGTQTSVQVDPNAPQAHTAVQDPDDEQYDPEQVQAIFNPSVGVYDVEADVGPAYATRRQETFHAISEIIRTNEAYAPVIGDLLFKAADFPLADKIAQRLHNMVPPQALGKQQPDPQISQLQQMLAKQHEMLQKTTTELQDAHNKLSSMQTDKSIEMYKAETDRMKAVGAIDPDVMKPVVRQLASEALGTPINPIIAAHRKEEASWEQVPEAPPSPIAPPAPQS